MSKLKRETNSYLTRSPFSRGKMGKANKKPNDDWKERRKLDG